MVCCLTKGEKQKEIIKEGSIPIKTHLHCQSKTVAIRFLGVLQVAKKEQSLAHLSHASLFSPLLPILMFSVLVINTNIILPLFSN